MSSKFLSFDVSHGSAPATARLKQQTVSRRASGFPDDMSTYGMVSGLWASFFSLGAFVGPSVAGVLYDAVGFRSGTLFPVGVHVLVVSWLTARHYSYSAKRQL